MTQDTVEPQTPESTDIRDERGHLSRGLLDAVRAAIGAGDGALVRALAGELHESDTGDLIEALDAGERTRFIQLLGDDFDFTTLTELEETTRVQVVENLPTEEVAEGVREIDSDDAVFILEDLEPDERERILEKIPAAERRTLAAGLEFPKDSAGRRMQTEVIAVPPFWTVGDTIDHMREDEGLPDEFYEIIVVDPAYRPIGTVGLSRLLRTRRPVPILDIVSEELHVVNAADDQEDVAREFERYNLVSAAVTDDSQRLVGVITVDDIVDVIEVEAAADIKALAGVAADEELSDNFWSITRGRFLWLAVNLATAVLASILIGMFSEQLQQMVALAILMPIVASQGGNAGTQTMTVTVRAIATRELGPHNVRRIIVRELLVGVANGVAFSLILGVVAYVWFQVPGLGVVIGLAMLVNLVAAAAGGVIIPLVLNRLRADPAVSSAAFVTTVTDLIGFLAFLGLAAWWFGLR
ncbi:MAG: magnesium transporter [Alphaproteobacteria bacterium]